MAKKGMDDLLKRRMSATHQASEQASELQVTDEAYQKLFRKAPPAANARICDIPLDKLVPFSTADIGFKPYSQTQLQAFADQLNEEGLMVRIIVRPVAGGDLFEILAGHNRTNAARLAGWQTIPAGQNYFVIISAQDSAYRFLSSLFFSLALPRLSDYARLKGKNGRLPVLVNFCLDEYCNIGYMEGIADALNSIRGFNMSCQVVVQSLSQWQEKYPGKE